MLQHQQETAVDSRRNQPVRQNQLSDPRVEKYLDTLCKPVVSALDKAHNREARTEMRVHLESLIEANIELGDSHEMAVEHAFEQFGKTQTVQRAWKRALPTEQSGSLRKSVGIALTFNSLAVALAMTVIPIGVRFADDLGWRAAGSIKELGIYALPAAAGLLTGMYAKRRPMLASLHALLLLLIPMTALDAWKSGGLGDSTFQIGPLSQLAIFLLCWIPFGCTGAGIGSMMRWLLQRSNRKAIAR